MKFTSYKNRLTIEDKTLGYIDIGTGPVLLLGHSYLWDAQMWAPQIEALSQQYRCIVPDLWGHGDSDSLPENCRSLQHIADHMLNLMDQLDIQEFSIIGLSVGGMWGAELALKAPKRVKSLAMLGCFVGFEPEVARAKYYTMLDAIKEAQTVPEALVDQIAPLFFAHNAQANTPDLFNGFKESLRQIKPEQIDTICRLGKIIFGRRDTLEEIESLNAPCLIMTGVEDTVRPVLEGYLMHDAIRGSEFIHIPQAGHISTLEQAEFVNQHLCAFLSQQSC